MRKLAPLAALVTAALIFAGAASTGSRTQASCSWGASSITAEWVDGKAVVSEPAATSCSKP